MAKCTACNAEVVKWMSYCPSCGDELDWPVAKGMDECSGCGSPAHPKFNYCFACGLDFEEEHEAREDVPGFELEWACNNEDCDGAVALYMLYCPWCGEQQEWDFSHESPHGTPRTSGECKKSLWQQGCGSAIDQRWKYCAFCGCKNPKPAPATMREWRERHDPIYRENLRLAARGSKKRVK
jgi:hypothetical protein